jgi:hypothetical protein
MLKQTIALLAFSTLTVSAAQAASSDSLALSGSVSTVNTIAVTPSGSYGSLNITGGETNATVASVDETSNNLLGYHITMSSSNGGELRNAGDSSKKTTYTISYNSASAVAPTASAQTVKNVSSLSGLTTNTSPVKINVAPYSAAPAGTYSDTVTLAIVAN